jgi:hypothetical protein
LIRNDLGGLLLASISIADVRLVLEEQPPDGLLSLPAETADGSIAFQWWSLTSEPFLRWTRSSPPSIRTAPCSVRSLR